jgi:prophage antirepressor-like protein
MDNLMIFEGNNVEVFELNGQVLFNPKHVGECLGIVNVNENIRSFNEKQVIKVTNSKISNTDFRKLHNTGENFLTESGVYKLIFKSRKENAERFQDWVTDEVLPTIRKTGGYKQQTVSPLLQQLINMELAQQQIISDVHNIRDDLETLKLKTDTEEDYFSIKGYASYIKEKVDLGTAQKLGKIASKLANERGIRVGKTKDIRFGNVKTYPEELLCEVFRGGL